MYIGFPSGKELGKFKLLKFDPNITRRSRSIQIYVLIFIPGLHPLISSNPDGRQSEVFSSRQ